MLKLFLKYHYLIRYYTGLCMHPYNSQSLEQPLRLVLVALFYLKFFFFFCNSENCWSVREILSNLPRVMLEICRAHSQTQASLAPRVFFLHCSDSALCSLFPLWQDDLGRSSYRLERPVHLHQRDVQSVPDCIWKFHLEREKKKMPLQQHFKKRQNLLLKETTLS